MPLNIASTKIATIYHNVNFVSRYLGGWNPGSYVVSCTVESLQATIIFIPVKSPWIFPGAPLKVNGPPGNIQGNLDRYESNSPLVSRYRFLIMLGSLLVNTYVMYCFQDTKIPAILSIYPEKMSCKSSNICVLFEIALYATSNQINV